jgi:hypothetical protein
MDDLAGVVVPRSMPPVNLHQHLFRHASTTAGLLIDPVREAITEIVTS